MIESLMQQASAHVAAVWAAVPPGEYDPSSGQGPEWGKAAPAGILIWIFLGVGLVVIVRSMTRHMRRVPKDADGRPSRTVIGSAHGWVDRGPDATGAAQTSGSEQRATSASSAEGRDSS